MSVDKTRFDILRESGDSWEEYLSDVLVSEWGDHATLQAVCDVYDLAARVCSTRGENLVEPLVLTSDTQMIRLAYEVGVHYDVLVDGPAPAHLFRDEGMPIWFGSGFSQDSCKSRFG